MTQVNDLLNRIPFVVIAMMIVGYLAYDYYDFLNSSESELGVKKIELNNLKVQVEAAKKKLVVAEGFFQNIDNIRNRIRVLSQKLDETKSSLSSDIDLANFIRMITVEAKRVGLTIKSIRPESEVKKDYYVEVPFNLALKGAYVQFLVFFDRVVRMQQIVRVGGFNMKPSGNAYSKYVDLEGDGTIFTYRYVGSKADDIKNQAWMNSNEEGIKAINELVNVKKPEGKQK